MLVKASAAVFLRKLAVVNSFWAIGHVYAGTKLSYMCRFIGRQPSCLQPEPRGMLLYGVSDLKQQSRQAPSSMLLLISLSG